MKFIARGVIGHLIIAAYWPLIEAATVIAYCSRILRGMSRQGGTGQIQLLCGST